MNKELRAETEHTEQLEATKTVAAENLDKEASDKDLKDLSSKEYSPCEAKESEQKSTEASDKGVQSKDDADLQDVSSRVYEPEVQHPEKQSDKPNLESQLWEKQADICNDSFDNSSAKLEKDKYGNDYKELTQNEKEDLSAQLKAEITNTPNGERGDYRVPEPEKIRGLSRDSEGNVKIDEAWKSGTDGAKEGTRRMEVVTAQDDNGNPTYIDRIGSNNGTYFSPMKEDGTPYSLRERATGDYLPEKNIEDNDSYHRYEVKQDFTRENFEAAIDNTYVDPNVNTKMHLNLNAYYRDATSSDDTIGHDGDAYKFSGEFLNGVKSGEIDNMFGTKESPDGGGKQYIAPFNARELEKMGMIEEINKEDY